MQSKGAEGNAVFCLWILLVVVVTAYYYPRPPVQIQCPLVETVPGNELVSCFLFNFKED